MRYIVTKRPEYFNYDAEIIIAEDALFKLATEHVIGFDLETTGLSFKNSVIKALLISTPEDDYVIDTYTVPIQVFKDVLESKFLVCQNGAFDLVFLFAAGIIPKTKQLYDTYLAELNMSLGIAVWNRDYGSLVKMYLGINIDKSLQSKIHLTEINDPQALDYMFNDAKYLIPIMNAQMPAVKKLDVLGAVQLDCRFIFVLAYIEYCGIYIDQDKWMRVCRRLEYEEYKALLELNEMLTELNGVTEINWDSQQQVVALFKELGIDTWDKREKKDTLNKKLLVKIDNPLVKKYMDYKEKNKAVTTYGRSWFDYVWDDGRIHTKFKPLVSTGRTSCGDTKSGPFPNIQNIKREKDMRSSFKSFGQYKLVNLDYSSQEGVVMADKCKDPALLEFYKSGGGDFHSYVASKIWVDELDGLTFEEIAKQYPEKRTQAKQAGFAIQFGGNGYTIANNLNVAVEIGEEVYEGFFQAFPHLKEYGEEKQREALALGYILINKVTGRKRFLEGYKYYRAGKSKPSTAEYKAIQQFENETYRLGLNTPVQGTAADISKTAGVLLFEHIVKTKRFGKDRMVNFVHDEYVFEITTSTADAFAQTAKDIMEKAASYYLEELTMKVQPVVSNYWGH
jgi:DNA polymerase-1